MPTYAILLFNLIFGLFFEFLAFWVTRDPELIKRPNNIGNVRMVRAFAQVFLTCAGVALYFLLSNALVSP